MIAAQLRRIWDAPAAWGFVNTAALAGYGLVVLPFQARLLDEHAMGVWYAFLAMGSLAIMVCQGGITPTVQRCAAYLFAGAERLCATGVPPASGNAPNYLELRAFSRTVRLLFWALALAAGALLFVAGFLFIHTTVADSALRQDAVVGWCVHSVGIMLLIPAAGTTALVQGAGKMLSSQRCLFAARCAAPLAVVAALHAGYGVISLGIGTVVMAVIQMVTHDWLMRAVARTESGGAPPTASSVREHLAVLWPTTWRFTMVTLGAWMITASSPLILAHWVGLEAAGRFGLTVQILQLCMTVAGVWMSTAIPQLCALRAAGDVAGLRALFVQRWRLGLITGVLTTAVVILCGDVVLAAIQARTQLIALPAMLTLAVVMLLELHHGPLCAAFVMTGNDVPFVRSALWSGLAVITLGTLLSANTALGVWSIILAQGLTQAAYNNWKWPLVAFAAIRRH